MKKTTKECNRHTVSREQLSLYYTLLALKYMSSKAYHTIHSACKSITSCLTHNRRSRTVSLICYRRDCFQFCNVLKFHAQTSLLNPPPLESNNWATGRGILSAITTLHFQPNPERGGAVSLRLMMNFSCRSARLIELLRFDVALDSKISHFPASLYNNWPALTFHFVTCCVTRLSVLERPCLDCYALRRRSLFLLASIHLPDSAYFPSHLLDREMPPITAYTTALKGWGGG